MLDTRALILVLTFSLTPGCRAPADPMVPGEDHTSSALSRHQRTTGLSLLEFIIIESRLDCLDGILSGQPARLEQARAKLLLHHELDAAGLLRQRDVYRQQLEQGARMPRLLEEARSSACPEGQPSERLRWIIADTLRPEDGQRPELKSAEGG